MELFEAIGLKSLMDGTIMPLNDWLSFTFFWMVVVVSVPVLFYGRGYSIMNGHSTDQGNGHGKSHGSFLGLSSILFVLSMIGVVVADNMVSFLVAWELMALFSLLLVFYEDLGQEDIKSGILYGVMTQLSGLMILGAFMYLYQKTGVLGFYELRQQVGFLTDLQRWVPLGILMIGFSIKAGLFPAHVWLPKAHPIAPSNVSALMSGLMVKMALYGMLRVTYGVFGIMPLEMAVTMLAIGMSTALTGVFLGLYKNRIKVFLAYSSVENMGILTMGFAASHIFANFGLKQLQVLALAAVLFHAVSHALFKSLLFMAAGAIQSATGEKNADALGGLATYLPGVARFTAVGAMAASAVPPLNGFIGEILFFMVFVMGIREVANLTVTLWMTGALVILAVCGGGALWMMVKGFGSVFLGAPRKPYVDRLVPVPSSMSSSMGLSASLVFIMGVMAPFVLPSAIKVSAAVTGVTMDAVDVAGDIIPKSYTFVIFAMIALAMILIRLSKGQIESSPTQSGPTWGCGFDHYAPHMQYTPDALTQPGGKFINVLTGYRMRIGKSKKKTEPIHFNFHTEDQIESMLYSRVSKFVLAISKRMVKLQYGYVQVYVLYIMLALFTTMYVVVRWL